MVCWRLRGRLFCSEQNTGFVSVEGGGIISGGYTRLQAGNTSCAQTGVQSGVDIQIEPVTCWNHAATLTLIIQGRTLLYSCHDYLNHTF